MGWDKFVCVRVLLDIFKFLCKYKKIRNKERFILVVILKYDRFLFFCFLYGIIGYIEWDCLYVDDGVRGGSWVGDVGMCVFKKRDRKDEGRGEGIGM